MGNEELRHPSSYEEPLCAEVGLSFFFLEDDDEELANSEAANPSYAAGVSICGKCSHRYECAEWGIKHEKWGLWGGLTPHDRIKIRRKLKITLKSTY